MSQITYPLAWVCANWRIIVARIWWTASHNWAGDTNLCISRLWVANLWCDIGSLTSCFRRLTRWELKSSWSPARSGQFPRTGASWPVVSIDGLQPEHDRRRSPATYARILENIAGQQIVTHCTITRQLLSRPGYLGEFCEFWSTREETRKIWFSLFTPQEDQLCLERLSAEDRVRAVSEIAELGTEYAKVDMPQVVLYGFLHPPASPREYIFAQVTACLSADLATTISPCQFGGRPVCSECGCIASAGLAAIGRHKLAGLVPVSAIFALSSSIGSRVGARELTRK